MYNFKWTRPIEVNKKNCAKISTSRWYGNELML